MSAANMILYLTSQELGRLALWNGLMYLDEYLIWFIVNDGSYLPHCRCDFQTLPNPPCPDKEPDTPRVPRCDLRDMYYV